ncbi:unnamed protein product, partial [Ectocarpus fasciculatus]
WIAKALCADTATDAPVSADPFEGCPEGSALRNMRPGDVLPYNNIDQAGVQMCDSYPLVDARGDTLYIHTFDYEPFNEFNQHSGSDGYDVYSVTANTVSYSNTKDGGGYGSTFFGGEGTPGEGWVLFPATDFLPPENSSAQAYWPIAGVYWEHDAQEFPGPAPAGYSTNTLTLWEAVPGLAFGGADGGPVKAMDALVSYHGLETDDGETPTEQFLQDGHLEVFYFTAYYGLTRWEVWRPDGEGNPAADCPCGGAAVRTLKGSTYTISDCHDWSVVRLREASARPAWPVVNANLLHYPHFTAGLVDDNSTAPGVWRRSGQSSDGHTTNWAIEISSTGADGNDGTGMAYLATNCGVGAEGHCGDQAVYQDIPATAACSNCTLLFGANARTAAGTGELALALQGVDDAGRVLWEEEIAESLTDDNGT